MGEKALWGMTRTTTDARAVYECICTDMGLVIIAGDISFTSMFAWAGGRAGGCIVEEVL